MVFKVSIKSDILKPSIEAVYMLVNEAKLKISADGISIAAVDQSNVAMVEFNLSKDAFEEYEATDGEIGIDLPKFSSILEMSSQDIITIVLDEVNHKLIFIFGGLTYTLSLLDPSSIKKEPRMPHLELPATVIVNGEELKRAIKASQKVSDYMFFGIKDDCFIMGANGDTDSVIIELQKNQIVDLTGTNSRSLFSLDYLGSLSKIVSSCPKTILNIGTNLPLKVEIGIAEGKGTVRYIIAPRVESDD